MSDDARAAFPDIDRNVATNLRHFREQAALSQDELAQRMTDRGFGFTQATIWKIESGQRPVKISEAVALGDALELLTWTHLTAQPEVSRRRGELHSANRRARQAYEALKEATTQYVEQQAGVLLAVREAQDAGLDTQMWDSWLDIPAERAVIEARLAWEQEDGILEQREKDIDAALQALRKAGYQPLHPEDVEISGGEPL